MWWSGALKAGECANISMLSNRQSPVPGILGDWYEVARTNNGVELSTSCNVASFTPFFSSQEAEHPSSGILENPCTLSWEAPGWKADSVGGGSGTATGGNTIHLCASTDKIQERIQKNVHKKEVTYTGEDVKRGNVKIISQHLQEEDVGGDRDNKGRSTIESTIQSSSSSTLQDFS